MKGRITMYNNQKGFGFIRGEDGFDRFFHISNVNSLELPSQGAIVEFTPSQNEKGLIAIDICIQLNEPRPVFIAFGNTRIKLNNIKNYGLSSETYIVEVEEELPDSIKFINGLISLGSVLSSIASLAGVSDSGNSSPIPYSDTETVKEERKILYLYVTTYQNDNHVFYEGRDNFDIIEKCKELDKWMGAKYI